MCQFINTCKVKKHSPGTKAFEKCRKISMRTNRTSKQDLIVPNLKSDLSKKRKHDLIKQQAAEKEGGKTQRTIVNLKVKRELNLLDKQYDSAIDLKNYHSGLVLEKVINGNESSSYLHEIHALEEYQRASKNKKEKYNLSAQFELKTNGKTDLYYDLLNKKNIAEEESEKIENSLQIAKAKRSKSSHFTGSKEFNNSRKKIVRARGKLLTAKKQLPKESLVQHKMDLVDDNINQRNLENVKDVVDLLEKKFAHQKAKYVFQNTIVDVMQKRNPLLLTDEDKIPQKAIESSQKADETLIMLEKYKQQQREIEDKIYSQDHKTFGLIRNLFSRNK